VSAGRIVAGTAILLATLAAGVWLGGHPAELPQPVREAFVSDTGGVTVEAGELIEDNYFREVSPQELSDASLQGMTRGLRRRYDDRFSEYLSPEVLKRFNEAISGRFSGIGLSVTGVPRGLRVEYVFRRSPADRAEIEVGDTIVAVDGRPIAGLGATAATELIKGPDGTAVTIEVLPSGRERPRRITLTRAEIAIPVVTSKVVERGGRKLGYVRLATFSEGAHAFLRRAVSKVLRDGAEGIVLDLRANGGGLFQEAVLTSSVFLPEGTLVVTTKSRTQGDQRFEAVGDSLPPLAIVVLIDGNTASAAEILAAALADEAGAEIVGRESFGKGVFQQEIELSNEGALKLTVGEYYTPAGKNLGGDGIDPDVPAADRPPTRRDEAIDRALAVLAQRLDRGG
jgi:carboxyl-terminal processing protease